MATPKVVRLPRLPLGWQDQPQLLERYWDEAMTAIEKALNDVLALPIIQEQLMTLDKAVSDAQEAAQDAKDAASGVKDQSDQQGKETSLNQSYVADYTGNLLTASADGSVTIATHKRHYGNPSLNPTVVVNGGSVVTQEEAGSVVRVYYVDPSRSGGAVEYKYTVDPDPFPVQSGDVHSVGAVTIPMTGIRPGNGVKPPGYVEA